MISIRRAQLITLPPSLAAELPQLRPLAAQATLARKSLDFKQYPIMSVLAW